ncbi:MAG: undecaprenyldiphospho-muramoylpentapeptide beta-N-acetylglucosaminyltransferase [Lachnospiraceae bacterium]|nr:undecaprenyldiphospho-muramoylpentapeptide beta-N-acetylglucosaminyltransferase [Lachnospiraceae bacterium]
MKRIVLTGGGTAGHVTPNIALIPALKTAGYDIHYIGSYEGMEKALIEDYSIPYHGISSGKLRRYFSLRNLSDPFRVIKGFGEANNLMKELKPSIVFSKGGFVSVPVVWAAKKNHIPVIIHESDMTPGLANKLSFSSASKICCNFPETAQMLPKEKAVLSGCPIRAELMLGDAAKAEKICDFADPEKPVIMVVGGSLGAVSVNNIVRKILPRLTEKFNVMHLCGKGKLDETLTGREGYIQIEYAKDEMKDLFALAEIVVSRAGANAICELLALHKPNLLIPLPLSASRGDQLLNAESFRKQGFSLVLDEDKDLTEDSLYDTICDLYDRREEFRKTMLASQQTNAVSVIMKLIEEYSLS